MKTILVDGRPLMRQLSGVGRFALDAINALSKNFKITVAISRPLNADVQGQLNSEIDLIVSRNVVLKDNRILWLYGKMPQIAKSVKPDIYFNPVGDIHPYGMSSRIKVVSAILDLVHVDFPDTMLASDRFIRKFQFSRTVEKSDLAWCISNFTESRLRHHFPEFKGRTVVGCSIRPNFYNPLTDNLEHIDAELRIKYKIPLNKKILLFVGNLEPRKNLKHLLSLVSELSDKGYVLVAVGCRAWENSDLFDRASYAITKGFACFPGYVDDADLANLYKVSYSFISSSIYEGFGLPQLEAMSSGCPVIASNNSAVTEIVAGGGILVDGYDLDSWLKSIDGLAASYDSYKFLALRRAKEFSWNSISDTVSMAIDEL